MPLRRLISAWCKPSPRGPSAHGPDPWGKPGPTFPSDGGLTGGSRLSPGRRLYAHFDARLLCFVLLLLLRSAAPGIAAPAATAEGERGMVATAQHEASEAGLQILRAGGNAIDAAVAVGYALAVVDPCCGNIGGGGFMLIRRADGHHTVINFRETAPRAATAGMFLDTAGNPVRDRSLYGYLAVGVPGTVMGLDRALTRHGRLGRAAVMAPAIALARDGFVLGPADAAILEARAARLRVDPEAARIFMRADGTPYQAGDRLAQSDLATSLSLIAKEVPDAL